MTKQLKLAVVLLVTAASMSVNAQKKTTPKSTKPATENKASKPTKQETMDWIAGKMKDNLVTGRKFISYNDGIFVTNQRFPGGIGVTLSIDLNKVTGISNEYSSDFIISGVKLYSVEESRDPGTLKYGQNIFISGPNYEDRDVAFNFTPDQALVERLRKAFTTLVEYNATKKGADEKF